MSTPVKLTDLAVKAVKPDPSGRREVPDKQVRGLFLRSDLRREELGSSL
jgi:hypothetical protein